MEDRNRLSSGLLNLEPKQGQHITLDENIADNTRCQRIWLSNKPNRDHQ